MTSLAPISSENPTKPKGLGILVIMYNAKSRQPMDGGAKKLGDFKKDRFSDYGEMKLYFLLILRCRRVNSTELVRQPRKLEFQSLS